MAGTVRVKHSDEHGNEYKVINQEDYKEGEHEIYEDKLDKDAKSADADRPMTDAERQAYEDHKAKRRIDANYGVNEGGGLVATDKNPSGTYSEPTPTDIRYPDKDATEFENNHGAFIGKSAGQMRESVGMEDKPGGLRPEVHEKVQEATEALVAAATIGRPPNPNDPTATRARVASGRAASGANKAQGSEDEDLEGMTVAELKEHAEQNNIDLGDAYLKADIIKAIKKHNKNANKVTE
jgi:hypothetical protein